MSQRWLGIFIVLLCFHSLPIASAGSKETALRMFDRLTGVPLPESDQARLEAMVKALDAGKPLEAAAIATDDPNFYDVTLMNWAASLDGRGNTRFAEFDDSMATLIGAVRDELDARTLLTGDYIYGSDAITDGNRVVDPSTFENRLYQALESQHSRLKSALKKVSPAFPEDIKTHAGLLTTRGWAKAIYSGGTNRRAVDFTFRNFLCSSVKENADATLSDRRIRQDVDREPGGSGKTYLNVCASCHAGMDPLAGAFSRLDFRQDRFLESRGRVMQPKVTFHAYNYPAGWVTEDESFINLWVTGPGASLGWRGKTEGLGVKEYGEMIANTRAFSTCMTKRVFREVCKRPEEKADLAVIEKGADAFEAENYNLKKLFQHMAVESQCVDE